MVVFRPAILSVAALGFSGAESCGKNAERGAGQIELHLKRNRYQLIVKVELVSHGAASARLTEEISWDTRQEKDHRHCSDHR